MEKTWRKTSTDNSHETLCGGVCEERPPEVRVEVKDGVVQVATQNRFHSMVSTSETVTTGRRTEESSLLTLYRSETKIYQM